MDHYVGMLAIFGFQWAPEDFAHCDGAHMDIRQYQMLYALIGDTYGGDLRTYFQVPNLSGRDIVSQGPSTASGTIYGFGMLNGIHWLQLTQTELPTHAHVAHFTSGGAAELQVSTSSTNAHQTPSTGDYLAAPTFGGADPVEAYVSAADKGTTVSLGGVSGGGPGSGTVTVDNAGAEEAFSVMNPYLVLNVCICHTGLFPMRP